MQSILVSALAVLMSLSIWACSGPAPEETKPPTAAYRRVGAWEGTGSRTLGDVSSEGHFRVTWQTRDESPEGSGTFRLTIRSGISGRPLEVAADHQGEGSGVVDFADSPRVYDFLVESEHVTWSFTVDDVVQARPRK